MVCMYRQAAALKDLPLPYSDCTPGYEEILTYLNSYLCVPYRSRPRRRQRLFNEGSSNPRCENGGEQSRHSENEKRGDRG